ncbi:MAG: PQQ-dependent sugar dehydrogenase [Lacisediminihabitans sp.]
MSKTRGYAAAALALAVALTGSVLTGCTSPSPPSSSPQPSPPATAPLPTPSATMDPKQALHPVGTPTLLATGLAAPWSVVRLVSGSTLISERDSGAIQELEQNGTMRKVGDVSGVVHRGEGGLLGIEVLTQGNASWLYAYLTTASDNRIVRMPLSGTPGSYSLGIQENILVGLAKSNFHNGGRIKFGPDGMLYATVGDATHTSYAQNPKSLNGKILRMTPTGAVPTDNPTPGSVVYSMGHRNPQGLAWDASGQLWASEFGQNTWDELNRIVPGGNYGWPLAEGIAKKTGFIDPVYQWKTAEASPSGLAFVNGTFFMATLRGARLWAIHPGPGDNAAPSSPMAYFVNSYGRIRDAVPGPDGTLWILTNNTDGRGNPQDGDDRLLQVHLGS